MTVTTEHIPELGIRIVIVPEGPRALFFPDWNPSPDVACAMPPDVAHVALDPFYMVAETGRTDDAVRFTLPGWRAFLAAVKAGEFDGLVP